VIQGPAHLGDRPAEIEQSHCGDPTPSDAHDDPRPRLAQRNDHCREDRDDHEQRDHDPDELKRTGCCRSPGGAHRHAVEIAVDDRDCASDHRDQSGGKRGVGGDENSQHQKRDARHWEMRFDLRAQPDKSPKKPCGRQDE
jgi:hypothetical protein